MYCPTCNTGFTYYLNDVNIKYVRCKRCNTLIPIKGSLVLINTKLIEQYGWDYFE